MADCRPCAPKRQDAPVPTLYGYPVSNYFNIVRAAMLEKGLGGRYVPTRASQDAAFLGRSALGKIPFLETEHGCVAETVAILDYLEEACGGTPLLPEGAFDRARVKQVVNICQVYLEVPLRSLFPGVFMGGVNEPGVVAAAQPVIERAMRALARLVSLRPFLLGDRLSQADLFAFYTFDIGERVVRHVYAASLIGQVPGLGDWFEMMRARPSSQLVLADFATAFAAYLSDKNAAWREPETKDVLHA